MTLDNITELANNYKSIIQDRNLIVIIGVITGFSRGKTFNRKDNRRYWNSHQDCNS